MCSSALFNIFFLIFVLQPFQILQQHGIQQANACLCGHYPSLEEELASAEWATHIQVVRKDILPGHQIRYTTKFLKIFRVPADWPYVELENSTGTIFDDAMDCAVYLTPMDEYLLAEYGAEPLNSDIYIHLCSTYWTRYWPDVVKDKMLMEKLDLWAAQLAADKLEKIKNAEEL